MSETKKNSICKETCIVIDRCSQFLQNSGSKLDIDSTPKNRGSLSFLATLQKTTWTCVVEGVTEYCRTVYDIFPSNYMIQILCSDESVADINAFNAESQNIQHILKEFGDLGPPKRVSEWEGPVSVYTGVAQAAENLLTQKTNDMSSAKSPKRMIVITALEDESDANSISNVVWEIQNQQDRASVSPIDLVVLNITNKVEKEATTRKQVSSHLDITTLTIKTLHCSNKIAQLARKHYNMRSTIITGIPMKEEQHAGTSANYDVEIVHSAAAHHDADWTDDSSTNEFTTMPPVTLKWCTPKANTIQDLQPCYGVYKVTPTEVNSRPAACLIMFLLQGRTVMLEAPRKSGTKVLTHMLQSHGGDVYIHVLTVGRSQLEDPPSITEGIGGRVTDYRVNDFGKLMKENRLAPYHVHDRADIEPNKKATERLNRYSKHWPMIISDTLIFNMQANLDPLLTLLLKARLTEEEVQECKKVIYKLQAMESRSDSLPLPIVTLKGKGTKKEEQYRQVWAELDTFIEGASETSFMHKKVLHCIRGTQESEPKSSDDIKVIDQSTVEKAWTELDRFQQMTEREKKDMNVVPSDPRRRKRNSESSTKSAEQQDKKSPNKQEETPKKIKRSTNSRNTLSNVTGTLQSKSSLMSIWSNHLNLTASRLHEDFIGRKLSVNGKFDLYQKDEETVSQPENKPFSSKTVKEWV